MKSEHSQKFAIMKFLNISLIFNEGKTNLIIGERFWKTTLISTVGLYKHDYGTVLFHGKDLGKMKANKLENYVKKLVCYFKVELYTTT